MSYLTPARAGRRRARIEETYERLIVAMSREIVDPETSPERRERCQESLLDCCARYALQHGMSAGRIYWGAIRKAQEGTHGGSEGASVQGR
jgi:hypothetical protein